MTASSARFVFRSLPLSPRSPAKLAFPHRCHRPHLLQQQQQRSALPRTSVRNASTAETSSEQPVKTKATGSNGFRNALLRTSLAVVVVGGYFYLTDTRASVHRYVVVPLIRWLYPDAEDAHHAGVAALKKLYNLGLHPRERDGPDKDGSLSTEVLFSCYIWTTFKNFLAQKLFLFIRSSVTLFPIQLESQVA